MDEKELYHWDAFVNWAQYEGVGLEYEEDWSPWWKCWVAAIQANVTLST
jgi:hypothetical protein